MNIAECDAEFILVQKRRGNLLTRNLAEDAVRRRRLARWARLLGCRCHGPGIIARPRALSTSDARATDPTSACAQEPAQISILQPQSTQSSASEFVASHLGETRYDEMHREKFLMAAATWETRLLQALADAVIAVDLELRVTYWSPAAEQLYGWTASEAIGHRLGLLLTKNLFFHDRTFAPLRTLPAGEVWRGEMRLRHKSGRDVDAHVTASAICDEPGPTDGRGSTSPALPEVPSRPGDLPQQSLLPRREIGYVLLHRATAPATAGNTKQPAKATIAQSGMLFHNSNDIVVILDSAGRIVAWNPAAERVAKWRANEVLNHSFEEFVQPVNDMHGIRGALTQHGAWRGEMTIYDRLGEEILLDSDITAVRDHGGNLLGIVTISRDITHTRRSETARRRSEGRLRALLSVIPDTFVRVDHKGNIQDFVANGPFHALLDGQTATGRNLREILPDVAPRLLSAIEQASAEKRIVHLPYHIDNPNGADSTGSLSDTTDLIFRVVSATEEVLVIIQDVTELYTIERQLRETEERFRHLVEQKQVGVYVIQDGRFVYVNPRFAELVGREREELLDMVSCLEIISAEDRELAWHNLQRRVAGESLLPYPLRLSRRDGEVVEVEIYASLTTYHGQLAVLGTVVDLTQRRLAERALRDSEQLYRTVVASLQEGILIFDAHAGLITGNESAQRLLGVPMDELHTLHRSQELFANWGLFNAAGQALGSHDLPHRLTLQDGQPLSDVVIGVRPPNGDLRWLSVNTRALFRDPDAPPSGVVVSFADITERRRTEEELQLKAFYDPLTRLPNRALFLDRVERALSQARRTDQLVAVGYLDLDYFKRINDTRGHTVGDHVLRQIADRIRSCLREGDTIGRMGGDEFTLLLPMVTGISEAARVAERLLEAIRQPVLVERDRTTHTVTASIGLSLFPVHGETPNELLRLADFALYRAKEVGRNSYQIYDPSITEHLDQAVLLFGNPSRPPQRPG